MAADVPRATLRVSRRFLPAALTGTPGVGKSAVARRLAGRWRVVEVRDLAVERRAARRTGRGWEVDLGRLRRSLRDRPAGDADLFVGHLAHLLPVRGAVVLRCQPVELYRRLDRARRGRRRDRGENALAESLDLVGSEVRGRRLPYWEVDTSARTPADVAEQVARALARGRPPSRSTVDWLADRRVTAHLLDWGR